MSAIARIFNRTGVIVSGSDLSLNENTVQLESLGANIYLGHSAKNIQSDVDLIVVTSAIRENNPELIYAKKEKIKIIKRAEALSYLLNSNINITVAGSHGKTTSSSYLTELLINLDKNPRYILGGVLKRTGSNSSVGSNSYAIAEADESDASFLLLNCNYSIITNIDDDHLDFYGGFEKLKETFIKFLNQNVEKAIINIDDEHTRSIKGRIANYISFGQSHDADYCFKLISMKFGHSHFKLVYNKQAYDFHTNITGEYNISNLVGAIACLLDIGLPVDEVITATQSIEGVKRRFDILFKNENKVVIDDYAHHPTELASFISSIKKEYPGFRITSFFEPHRYTRTKNFWDEFKVCFNCSDFLYLLPIYAASEDPIANITSESLFSSIEVKNKKYLTSLNAVKDYIDLEGNLKEVILCLGAGPISKTFREIFNASRI